MKKLISLLLVVIFICSALLGCDWGSILNKSENVDDITSTSTTTITATTTNPLFPENPTIEHGDNFTDEDIEFIMHLHGQKIPPDGYLITYNLFDIMYMAKHNSPIFLMHLENPYVIAAYLKPDQYKYQKDDLGYYCFDASKYVWYKFFEGETVPKVINDMRLSSHSYVVPFTFAISF